MQQIKFGTSGWRGIISDDFTFENVKIVVQAIADFIKQTKTKNKGSLDSNLSVVIGYDTRFLSKEFAQKAAMVLAANNIRAYLSCRDVPTPVIAYYICRQKMQGGINFTASHNPAEYNGIKFSRFSGGPALPEETKIIEKKCVILKKKGIKIKEMPLKEGLEKKLIKYVDLQKIYMRRINQLVDLKMIGKRRPKIIVDLMYGTGRNYLDDILQEAGCRVKRLHDWIDAYFGGHTPEPSFKNMSEAASLIKKEKASLVLGLDGDADRFGIIDADGSFISPNQVLALLLAHLLKTRKWKGVVARSVATSSFVDAIAKKHGIPVRETPVGFKYIGDIMTKEEMIIGGEESGGLTIKGHIPEKDGILACLLIAEMVAYEKKSIKEILKNLYKEFGLFLTDRINFRLTTEKMEQLKKRLKENPPSKFGDLKVSELITIDGFKFVLQDTSWVMIRFSGTEPVVRYYIETNSQSKMRKLTEAGKLLVTK